MRVMIKFRYPVEAGISAIRRGKVEKVFQQIHDDLKPEAAYFFPEGENGRVCSWWRCRSRPRSRKSPNVSSSG